jgi:hypothetical protein
VIFIRILWAVTLVVLVGVAFSASPAAEGEDPFNGTWKLNPSRSRMPAPLPKCQVVRIKVDGQTIWMQDEIIPETGEKLVITVEGKLDGKDNPVKGTTRADTAAYQRPGPRTITGIAKKDAKVVVTETAVVSRDGKTLTVTYYHQDTSGKRVRSAGVFEKQ